MAKSKKSAVPASAKAPKKGKSPVVARKPTRRRRSSGDEGGFLILVVIALLATLVIEARAAAVVVVGIIPTLVMSFTDQHKMKSARIQCVSLLNLSGVTPFAFQVYQNPTIWQEVFVQPVTMVVMWGSAAVGYLLLYVGPIVASIILQALAQDKLKNIMQQRTELIEQWGTEVLGDQEEKAKPQDNFIRPKKE